MMNAELIRGLAELRAHRPGFELEPFKEVYKFEGQYRSAHYNKSDIVLDLTLWLIPAPWRRTELPAGPAPIQYVEIVFEENRGCCFQPGNGFPLRFGSIDIKSVSHLQHEGIHYDITESEWAGEPDLLSLSLSCWEVFIASFGTISDSGTSVPSWTFDRESARNDA